jgi:histone deacetylase complex subunit SAP18
MSAPELKRDETPPFLVKLFYRTGAFHRYIEFPSPPSAS